VPPAALAIHLCIGMAYGFSVVWLPLSQSLGITKPIASPAGSGIINALFTTSCDGSVADLGWMFTLFFVVLCSSAALWRGWLDRSESGGAGWTGWLRWWIGGGFRYRKGVLAAARRQGFGKVPRD
jgi:hypothetical protein